MEDQAGERPPGDELDAEVGPAKQQGGDKDHHIRVAARGDRAETCCRSAARRGFRSEPLDEDSLDYPLRDIAADDRPQHHRRDDRLERTSVNSQPVQPGPVPEWRVDEVDAMVEHLAPFRRGAGHPGKLPIDRVEHHEDEARQHAQPIVAAPEQEEGENAKDAADQRHEVGRDARTGRPSRQIERGLPPQIERQQIGDALIGRVIGRALDGLGIVGIERQHERPLALPELGVIELGRLGRKPLEALRHAAIRKHLRRRSTVLLGRDMRHHRLTAEGEHRTWARPHSLQPGRVPGVTHVREKHRALRLGGIGALESRIRREPEHPLAGVHSERPGGIFSDGNEQQRRVTRHAGGIEAGPTAGKGWLSGDLPLWR